MELSYFVDEYLYPAIWRELNEVFPEMSFTYTLGKWRSPKCLDGSEPDTKRKDKTVVTQRLFHVALENGGGDARGRARDLISLYMEHNSVTDRIEAIKQITQKLGLAFPEGANAQKYEAARKRREGLALSYDRQKRALFSPEGAEALRYLKEERGYSEELIKEMGLGYISPDEARNLEENYKVGIAWRVEDYPLSIAYFSRGNVMGFKFRAIKSLEGRSKYMNTKSLGTEGMDSNPFGLTPNNLRLGDKEEKVVVVEGELDALHAIALGLPNVIAVAGGKITEGKASALKKNGYKSVVILLDSDEAGQRYTGESIERVDNIGLNSLVATIPEGKDTDEYLKNHSIAELQEVISGACFGGLWIYMKERDRYLQGSQTEAEFLEFLERYITIASRYRDPLKREILFEYLRKDFQEADVESIEKGIRKSVEQRIDQASKGSLRENALSTVKQASASLTSEAGGGEEEEAENIAELQEALKVLQADEKRKQALQEVKAASALLTDGKEKEATQTLTTITSLLKALGTLNKAGESEFSSLLKDNTEKLWGQYRENQVGLRSNFTLTNKEEGDEPIDYDLFFPSGAISIIGAVTGHGKSKILQNVALDALEEMSKEETLLYITYEENELNVNMQFLNVYANLNVKPEGTRGSNAQTIMKYLSSGDKNNIRADVRDAFQAKEEEWKAIRRSGKIKIVKPDDNYLETLLSLITFSVKNFNIKAIFIDYVQEIYVREWAKYSRTDELKAAMVSLDAVAQRTRVPIIMGAQLKRETNSPLDLYNQYIADSGWIERKASEILLVWSSKEKCKGEGTQKTQERVEKEIPGLHLGKAGQLYFKITKSRIVPTGSSAIVKITGSTGRIGEGRKREKPTQGVLPLLPTSAPGGKIQDDNVVNDPETQRPFRKEEEGEELPF